MAAQVRKPVTIQGTLLWRLGANTICETLLSQGLQTDPSHLLRVFW